MSSSPKKLIDLITIVDNVPLDFDQNHDPYYLFFLSPDDPRPHGFILPDTIAKLPWPPSFIVDRDARSVTITAAPTPSDERRHINNALQDAVDAALATESFPTLSGLHSEPFLIPGARSGPVHVERFAASLFGIATRGSHMTAYTRSASNGSVTGVWVARRSHALFTYPGKLDSTVAGGVKATDSPTACILAEAGEEASLPHSLIESPACRSTGVITLANRNPRTGLFHSEILYVYDLELPDNVIPTPSDGEVESFILMPIDEVRRRMNDGEFKPNVCPVMIDFMMRHGFITPETEGEGSYVELSNRLRRRLPVPMASDR